MSRDELERLLEDAGSVPAPEPDAAFVERLEQRLLGAPAPERSPVVRPRLAHRVALAGAAAAVVLVVVAVVVRDDGPDTVTLDVAADTEIVLPGGIPLEAFDGIVIPDGAIIRTGPDGEVQTDDTVLGPNTEAEVVDGELAPVPTTAPPSTAVGPATTAPPTSVAPPTTAPAPPSTVPRPATTTPPATSAPTTSAPAPAAQRLRLAAVTTDRGVALRWSPYHDDGRFAGYLVLRSAPRDGAEYPPAGTTTVVARIDDVTRTTAHDQRAPAGRDPVYRVVAVDAEGKELARSEAISPGTRAP